MFIMSGGFEREVRVTLKMLWFRRVTRSDGKEWPFPHVRFVIECSRSLTSSKAESDLYVFQTFTSGPIETRWQALEQIDLLTRLLESHLESPKLVRRRLRKRIYNYAPRVDRLTPRSNQERRWLAGGTTPPEPPRLGEIVSTGRGYRIYQDGTH